MPGNEADQRLSIDPDHWNSPVIPSRVHDCMFCKPQKPHLRCGKVHPWKLSMDNNQNNGLATVGMIICFIGLFLTIITISCVSSNYFDYLDMFNF